jgi:RNA polymerase sigma-70 factor (ECF subfamily)
MDLLTPAAVAELAVDAEFSTPRAEADSAMDRYARGDDAAFALVYDRLAPRLYGYLLRRTRDRSMSEDIVQQTMLHMHRARGRFIAGAAVTPWAFAIAHRLLVDGLRRAKRERTRAENAFDADPSPSYVADEAVRARELGERIRRALRTLPESQREAFELVKQEGFTMAEAAEVLGTTVAAVKLRSHRACVTLRAALGDDALGLEQDP